LSPQKKKNKKEEIMSSYLVTMRLRSQLYQPGLNVLIPEEAVIRLFPRLERLAIHVFRASLSLKRVSQVPRFGVVGVELGMISEEHLSDSMIEV
jgi:hypothetical protein